MIRTPAHKQTNPAMLPGQIVNPAVQSKSADVLRFPMNDANLYRSWNALVNEQFALAARY